MKRFHILLFLLVACFATAMLAQTPTSAPKPDPALKKLGVLVGPKECGHDDAASQSR